MPHLESRWLPEGLAATSWEGVAPYYDELLSREPRSAGELEELVLHKSEVDSTVDHEWSSRTIATTCRTDDESAAKAYAELQSNLLPQWRRAGAALDRRIVGSRYAAELDADRYRVYLRDLRAGLEIHRDENVALQAEEAKVAQEFNTISGAQTVDLDGETMPLARASARLDDPDESRRREAWVAVAERRAEDRDAIDDVLDRLVALRDRIGRNAGFRDYRDYKHVARRRFDYAIADCETFHASIAATAVPLVAEEYARKMAAAGRPTARPWDMFGDPLGRAALRPFTDARDLVARTARLFARLHPGFAALFERMRDGTSLDLESRPGKAPGGYQVNRDGTGVPFIFMNAAGREMDVNTLLHECGHAFHSFLCWEDPLFHYREPGPEISETCSMSMELLTLPYLDEFYAGEDLARARRARISSAAQIFPRVGQVDAFQHWLYTNPEHSRAERAAVWEESQRRFLPWFDWSGFEPLSGIEWQRIPHLFQGPFYFVEYGIAQLGALQMWRRARNGEAEALAGYVRGMRLGASRPLPELYEAMGLRFDFGTETMRDLVGKLRTELASLPL